ncbi:MAG: hypothetical protein ACK4XK_07890 [Casimicrobiaceae bacterium]
MDIRKPRHGRATTSAAVDSSSPDDPRQSARRELPHSPRRTKAPRSSAGLPLPHERDESPNAVAVEPDPLMVQARRDLESGQVDTDMRATPGLDAERRTDLVPGPGGKPMSRRR